MGVSARVPATTTRRAAGQPGRAAPAVAEPQRPRDPVATRARILAAATVEFARKGLAGGRVDAIAARAKINKRMLYHYFKNKNGLYLAVLEEAYGSIRAAERRLDLEHLDPVAAIVRLAEFTWDYFVRHPEFLRLLTTENLHKAAHLKRSDKIAAMHSHFVALIGDLLERGARSGLFRTGVDPMQLYVSIAALGYYYLSNQYTLSVIYSTDLGSKEALAMRRKLIVDLVVAYLRPPPPDHPAPSKRTAKPLDRGGSGG